MNKPLHQHDCTKCEFLGIINRLDAYACIGSDSTTYILRNSREGSDYASLEDFENRILEEHKRTRSYSSSFSDEEIRIDRMRRVLIQLLNGTIASSMGRDPL